MGAHFAYLKKSRNAPARIASQSVAGGPAFSFRPFSLLPDKENGHPVNKRGESNLRARPQAKLEVTNSAS